MLYDSSSSSSSPSPSHTTTNTTTNTSNRKLSKKSEIFSASSSTPQSPTIITPSQPPPSSSSSSSKLNTDFYLKLPQSQSLNTTPVLNRRQANNMPEIINYNNNNNNTNNQNNNYQVNDLILTTKQIDELQESIRRLNDQIFKDPSNRRRPPSEYIELFDRLTEKLHASQKYRDTLEQNKSNDNCYYNTDNYEINNINSKIITQNDNNNIPVISSIKINNGLINMNDNISQLNENNSDNNNKINGNGNSNHISSNNFIHNDDNNYKKYDNDNNQNNSPLIKNKHRTNGLVNIGSIGSNTSYIITNGSTATLSRSDQALDSLIRIYTGNSTAVIKRQENYSLKDSLTHKMKTRNIDIAKCIAYCKDTYKIIEWSTDISKIESNQIVVVEKTADLGHNFEKKTVTFRLCDPCKRRNILHAYTCTKCEFTMCPKEECRSKSESYVCIRKNPSSRSDSDSVKFNPNETSTRKFTQHDFSQQILPVDQLVVVSSARDRSRSENDLVENCVDSENAANVIKQVPKSPTTIPKNMTKDPTHFGTMPRSQFKPPNSSRPPIDTTKHTSTKPTRRDSLNAWEIPYSQIKDTGRQVGSGSFGTVHEGTDFYHDKVAIKFLNVQNPTPSQTEAFRNEAAILKTTRHDNILLFIGCISKPFLAIVTEWCEGSSLYKHLHVEDEHWNMYQLIDIAKQTATGMEYLHARDILHRDLKSNNIFLIPDEKYSHSNNNIKTVERNSDKHVEKWTVKIGDFGLATVKTAAWTKSSAKTSNPTGSILWMAPEVITQKVPDPYTQKSDIYSFGVVLYELVTCSLPYAQKEQDTILFLVGIGRLRPNPEDSRKDTPLAVKNLITQCCEYDRNKRPMFDKINSILKVLKVARLQRAQSAPNLHSHFDITSTGASIIDDDIYPTTPLLENNLIAHFTTNL